MSLVPQLLRLASQYRYAWAGPQLCCMPPGLHVAVAATSGNVLPPPPASRHSSSSSSSRGAAGRGRVQQHQRRRLEAGAGRRGGNLFLDDSAAGRKRRPPVDENEVGEPMNAGPLFDSSRFNYDSDEEQQQQQHDSVSKDAEGQWQEDERGAATAAAAALQQQGRRQAKSGEALVAAAEEEEGEGVADIVLPPPRGVRVKTAEFIKSSTSVDQCPPPRFPEFAVIGRSNVGKSSLINMLTGRNALAMVSKTPGKTRLINHFFINGAWFLVDLPGYGYAKASKGNVVEWNRFTREYFVERETLVTVLLLVDSSIPPMPLDISCAAWFAEAGIPFTVVFTKLDKRKKGGSPSDDNIAAFEQQVEAACGYAPPTLLTSAKSGKGRNEVLAHVAQLRELFNKSRHGTL